MKDIMLEARSKEKPKDNLCVLLMKQMRVRQWSKNLLVFAAILFDGSLFKASLFLASTLAFLSFSFISSTVYIINDIMDVEKDRQHPKKCSRPIASKAISIGTAKLLAIILLFGAIFLASRVNCYLIAILIVYFSVNILYSLKLKHVVIIDVMIIALGFVLRALAGVIAIGATTTHWFILCVMMLSLFLGLGKRKAELELFSGDNVGQRKVLQFYSVKLLDQLITIVSAMTITSYSLYAAVDTHNSPNHMMLTIPLVVYGMFHYLYLINNKKDGEQPEEILLKDRPIQITIFLYVIYMILIRNL